MNILFPVPIAIFLVIGLGFLLFSKKAKGLKCILAVSYCGVMIVSFTGGVTGGMWLGPFFILLVGSVVIWRNKEYIFGATTMAKLTIAMLVIYGAGVIVGLLRYDPIVAEMKMGRFTTLLGLPIGFLMALYRFNTVLFLFLAFAVPLRYHVDRPLFLQCLKICWFFTCVLAISEILDFFDIVDMAFTIERLEGYVHMGVWGFIRAGFGKMLVIGAFMSFTMTQLTKSHLLKILGYSSFPLVAVGLLCSYSRSSMVSFALSVMALIVMLGGVRAFKGLVIAVISFAAIYIIMAQLPEVQERFMTFLTLSRPGDVKLTYRDVSAGRIEGWLIMINWLLTRPDVILIGTGFQNFNYFVNLTAGAGTLESGHNSFLQVLIEVGVIGLVVFICWIVSIFSWLLRWRRSMTNPLDRMVPGIFFSLMLGLVASCAVSETLVPAAGVVILQVNIYILLGIWISYYRSQMLELNVPAEGEYADYEMNEETAQLPQEDPTYEY